MKERILVVDDEPEIADLIEMYLLNENFDVTKLYDGKEAQQTIDSATFDLAILDIMLPGVNGFELCKNIRESHQYPIIMLTAKDEEIDKINGLTLGADDYVTKPFRPLELIARVKAQLRRYKRYNSKESEVEQEVFLHGELLVNPQKHEAILGDNPLTLTPTEFDILRILCEKRGQVVSSEELFHAIWKDEYYSKANNTITVHIRHLRQKLGDTLDNPKYIKTIWGVGYKIEN